MTLSENCNFYRTKDILNGPYEEIKDTFPFWDPSLFQDDDGRVYFYWGCASETPIYGVEMDPGTMMPLGERKELIFGNAFEHGYERTGAGHGSTVKDLFGNLWHTSTMRISVNHPFERRVGLWL